MNGEASPSNGTNRVRRASQLVADLIRRRLRGEQVSDQAVVDAHPDLMPELGEKLSDVRRVEEAEEAASACDHIAGWDANGEAPPRLPLHSFPGYELLAEVHRGGQGVVYRAIQTATGRDVAVKVLSEGPFASPQGRARFEREVRVLAQLKHANIVTIHDSGVTAGHLYFVMDWISGDPLDAYLVARAHGIEELLRLFAKTCQAVHAAHLRGVIHRDLKPSNILIDERDEPHILDFGLAKLSPENAEQHGPWPSMTATGQFIGSLPWAAPEQTGGSCESIDLRTDVYALGLILYHMLTGRFPYGVTGPMREVFENILNAAPASLRSIRRDVSEDVETIVLKCLAKEPDRRYESAAALPEDVERFLVNEPVLARAPSTMYQVKKLLLRNKLPVALIAAFLVSLILFAGGMAWLYAQAVRQRDRASNAERRAKAINEFLIDEMLTSARPEYAQGADISVQEVLENAASRIEGAFSDDPLVEAGIRSAIGQSYMSLGLSDSAEHHLREAVAILTRRLGDGHEDTLRAQSRMIDLLYRRGDFAEAVPLASDTLASLTQWGLEGMLHRSDLAAAEERFREAYEVGRRTLGQDHPETLRAAVNLAYALMETRKLDAAETVLVEAPPSHLRILGEEHPDTLMCTMRVALLRKEQDRIDEAENLSRRGLDISRRLLGDDHPVTMSAGQFYGTILLRHGKNIAAAEVFRDALNPKNPAGVLRKELVAQALDCLSVALARMGRYEEAERGHREALRQHRRYMKNNPLSTVWPMRCLIRLLAAQGREDEARLLAEELLEIRREFAGKPGADAYQLNCYARALMTVYPTDLRDPIQALGVALKASDLSADAYHYNRYTIALAYEMNGDLDQAVEFARRALAHIPVEYSTERTEYEAALVRMLEKSDDEIAAQAVYRETLAQRRERFPEGHLDIAESLVRLGETLIRHGEFDEAESYLRDAVEIRANALDEGDWHIGEALSLLGASLAGQERAAEAEPLLTKGFTILVKSPMAHSNQARLALNRIEEFLRSADRSEEIPGYLAMLPDPMDAATPEAP